MYSEIGILILFIGLLMPDLTIFTPVSSPGVVWRSLSFTGAYVPMVNIFLSIFVFQYFRNETCYQKLNEGNYSYFEGPYNIT